MAKIYTRGGDKGETSLLSGKRVGKHHEWIEAYGGLDEINSQVGMVRALLSPAEKNLDSDLQQIQNQLFNYGSHLACDDESFRPSLPPISKNQVQWLEQLIDRHDAELDELKNFILPGGSSAAAALHVARTLCRRVERFCTSLPNEHPALEPTVQYLNRLSDAFFVMARAANKLCDQPDIKWSK